MYNLQFVTTFTRVSSMAFTPCKLVLEKRGDIYQKRLKKKYFYSQNHHNCHYRDLILVKLTIILIILFSADRFAAF